MWVGGVFCCPSGLSCCIVCLNSLYTKQIRGEFVTVQVSLAFICRVWCCNRKQFTHGLPLICTFQDVMSPRFERYGEEAAAASLGWQPDLTSTGCFVCLLGTFAYIAMATKKKVSSMLSSMMSGSSASSSKRPRRGRSMSVSLDLECLPGRTGFSSDRQGEFTVQSGTFKKSASFVRGGTDRNRTVSACESVDKYVNDSLKPEHLLRLSCIQMHQERFPFQKLPVDCKLKVFSFLTVKERGLSSQVCSEWRALIKSSSLWNTVDLTTFPLCHIRSQGHECSELCYALYRNRVKKFFQYLRYVRPALKRLRFAYDIGDYRDGWLECLQSLIRTSRCQELEYAHLNWKETPIKPYWRDSMTWSTSDYNELMHRHRHRQRLFVNFFVSFCAAAPNLSKLILPFDWSSRSLQALSRLRKLEILVLEKYFVFQSLEQDALDQLLRNVPSVRRLILEIWTPSGRGMLLYTVKAENLEYLDISQCRGFYLRELDMPKVKIFKMSRHPWNGPLVTSDSIYIPCVYDVLRDGAPNLTQINEHLLQPDWRDCVSQELETVLGSICSCREHKSGWVM